MAVHRATILEVVPWSASGPGWGNSGIRVLVRRDHDDKPATEEWLWFDQHQLRETPPDAFKAALALNELLRYEARQLVTDEMLGVHK